MMNIRLFKSLAAVILLLCSAVVSMADVRFASGNSALKIPFKLWNNHIYIQTSVDNSKPLWLLLDTGARNIINRRNAETLGLKLTPGGQSGGVGETVVNVWSTKNVSFALPGVVYSDQKVRVVALESVEECANKTTVDPQGKATRLQQLAEGDKYQPIDGVLGAEFLKTFVVEIDYEAQLINLYDPKTYQYTGNGEAIPLEFSGTHIFVRAPVTIKARTFPNKRFLIDTGAMSALILNEHFVGMNDLLPSAVQTKPKEVCGVGGKSQTQVGTIEGLRLKNFNIENPNTLFSQAKSGVLARTDFDGIIGNAILRHFGVVFDYSRSRIILESSATGKNRKGN